MNMVDKVFEEVRSLPEFELRQVLDFVGFLKSRHGLYIPQPANDAASIVNEEEDWGEFEKLAGTWSGKFQREDCYERKVLR